MLSMDMGWKNDEEPTTHINRKRQRFSLLAAKVALCSLHVPGQQSFNLFQRVSRRNVLQYMM